MGTSEDRNVGKLIRDLQRRKARERRGMIIAEGRRLVVDALDAGADVVGILAADDAASGACADLVGEATRQGLPVEIVPRREFDETADTETPSGVLAAVRWEPRDLNTISIPLGTDVALVLDGVQDPGNVGTMIRTAHALGAWCTIALDGTADVRSPKVVRAAMGAHFRHDIAVATAAELMEFAAKVAADPCVAVQDGTDVRAATLPPDAILLVVGSEGHGVRADWDAMNPVRLTIPMRPGAESLNASVAAGILLHELIRARA